MMGNFLLQRPDWFPSFPSGDLELGRVQEFNEKEAAIVGRPLQCWTVSCQQSRSIPVSV